MAAALAAAAAKGGIEIKHRQRSGSGANLLLSIRKSAYEEEKTSVEINGRKIIKRRRNVIFPGAAKIGVAIKAA